MWGHIIKSYPSVVLASDVTSLAYGEPMIVVVGMKCDIMTTV